MGRTWAFNSRMPDASGAYDAAQFRALDAVVASAAVHGVRLVLGLGNFWPAYLPPEQLLATAEGSAAGKDIAGFYVYAGVPGDRLCVCVCVCVCCVCVCVCVYPRVGRAQGTG